MAIQKIKHRIEVLRDRGFSGPALEMINIMDAVLTELSRLKNLRSNEVRYVRAKSSLSKRLQVLEERQFQIEQMLKRLLGYD